MNIKIRSEYVYPQMSKFTVKDIDSAIEALPDVSEWDKNGRFVLETSNEKAKEIFHNVK